MTTNNSTLTSNWRSASLLTLASGTVFATSSALINHPFDTIKTKMQAQSEYMTKKTTRQVIFKVWKREGLPGFYRGILSTLCGALMFRSLGIFVYRSLQAFWSQDFFMTKQVPGLFGFQRRELAGCALASSIRSFIECPFENAKVKRQTARTWRFRSLYKGVSYIFFRNLTQMFVFVFTIDLFARYTDFSLSVYGQFAMAGVSSTVSWLFVWPLETMKNMVQAEISNVGRTVRERLAWVLEHRGRKGLYRGLSPGLVGVFVSSGAAYVFTQKTMKSLEHQIL